MNFGEATDWMANKGYRLHYYAKNRKSFGATNDENGLYAHCREMTEGNWGVKLEYSDPRFTRTCQVFTDEFSMTHEYFEVSFEKHLIELADIIKKGKQR